MFSQNWFLGYRSIFKKKFTYLLTFLLWKITYTQRYFQKKYFFALVFYKSSLFMLQVFLYVKKKKIVPSNSIKTCILWRIQLLWSVKVSRLSFATGSLTGKTLKSLIILCHYLIQNPPLASHCRIKSPQPTSTVMIWSLLSFQLISLHLLFYSFLFFCFFF